MNTSNDTSKSAARKIALITGGSRGLGKNTAILSVLYGESLLQRGRAPYILVSFRVA